MTAHDIGAQDMAARLRAEIARLGIDPNLPIGLAVSGGGDSMAMLHLAQAAGLTLRVATVDHGLRAGAAAEAALVAQVCAGLGLGHDTLRWQGWDGRGNVQDRARRARRALLADWAQAQGLDAVALAHTQGDLAEGFIMRLARGAGVDGLAAMESRFTAGGAVFIRPMLWASRAALRDTLRSKGAVWVDDPSNAQDKYHRVRARNAMPDLAKLGLSEAVLAGAAQHMAQARAGLEAATDNLARAALREGAGIVTILPIWQSAPPEVQRRLIQRVILWLAPSDYAPRGAAVQRLLARLAMGAPAQLAGCGFTAHKGQIFAYREGKAAGLPVTAAQTWDGVWRVSPAQDGPSSATLGALGAAGLAQWQGWRATGLPRAALITQPSLWTDGQLWATPLHPDLHRNSAFLRSPAADSLFSARLSH